MQSHRPVKPENGDEVVWPDIQFLKLYYQKAPQTFICRAF